MNSQHRAIRALLQTMSPRRAVEYIQSFQLRPEEEAVLTACDVRGLSYTQAADKLHLSPEVIKDRKRRAYSKIADEINFVQASKRFQDTIVAECLEIGMSEHEAREFLKEI